MLKRKVYGFMRMALCLLIPLAVLTACGRRKGGKEEPLSRIAVSDLEAFLGKELSEQVEEDGAELRIRTSLEAENTDGIFEATLSVDEAQKEKFLDAMLFSNYDEVKESVNEAGDEQWNYSVAGQTAASCTISEAGRLVYTDFLHDVNCPIIDEYHIFEYGYVTEEQPGQIGESAGAAGNACADFLSQYSCLSFEAWNALAGYDAASGDSCYNLSMQATYRNVPVSIFLGQEKPRFSVEVVYSGERIISLQGAFFYKEEEGREVTEIADPTEIVEKMKHEFSIYAASNDSTVVVDRIQLEYFPQEQENHSYALVPVWDFYCTDTRQESKGYDKPQEIQIRYNYVYAAEDGDLLGVYSN